MSALDLATVRDVLEECLELVDDLNGRPHVDPDNDATTRSDRAERAATSRSLQFLATRMELGAALTRSEYWTAKGHPNHLNKKKG